MFSADRTPLAAAVLLLLSLPLSSVPGGAATPGSTKPKDFGTTQVPVQMLRGGAALAGLQSVSATIVNNPICAALYDQTPPASISDGGGGTVVVWSDFRGGDQDIYAQKLDAAGNFMWASDGVPVCKQAGAQSNPRLLSDGAGGAFVVWEDARVSPSNLNIYVQRINSLGVTLWGAGGVLVCGAANNQRQAVLSPNGLGGVLVAWVDERGVDADIYAQRMNASGVPQWTANGVAVCTATGIQQDPAVVSDTQGGALLSWRDERAGVDIYAQRVNETGAVQWAANGLAVSAVAGNQEAPVAIPDGTGGMIVSWIDSRGADQDIYAQRMSSTGAAQWAANGAAVCVTTGNQRRPRLCTDGANGAIVTWEDGRGASTDVYAQRIGSAGTTQWLPATGVAVCTAPSEQLTPAVTVDPVGGAIVAWSDARNGGTAADVYAQHVQPGGTTLWTADGVRLCDATGVQDQPDVVADGTGGAAVSWRDYRNSSYSDIFGQRVDANGQVPDQCVPPDTLSSSVPITTVATQNYRTFDQGNFFWSGVAVFGTGGGDWDLEQFDQGGTGLGTYPTCFGLPLAGSYGMTGTDFVVSNFNDLHTPPGVFGIRAYRYSGAGGAKIEWDDGQDQMVLGTPISKTNSSDLLDVWDIPLTAGVAYTFDFSHSPASDFKVLLFSSFGSPGYYYVVPRTERVMETGGRYGTYTAPSTEYYGVAIVNDNGVAGDYTLTVRSGIVGVGDPEAPATRLMGMSPNPGKGPVAIRFALREPGRVSFQVYDMAGRAVASIPGARWQPGSWSVQWDGRDARGSLLSAGVYFVQMNVNDRRVGFGRLALLH